MTSVTADVPVLPLVGVVVVVVPPVGVVVVVVPPVGAVVVEVPPVGTVVVVPVGRICHTSFLPTVTQTKLTNFVFCLTVLANPTLVHLAPAFGCAAETICVVDKVAITTQLAMTVRTLNLRTDSIEQMIFQKVHFKCPKRNQTKWWALRDLNPRPSPCKGDALAN